MAKTWQGNAGLLVLRAGVGGLLAAHGAQKLSGWFGGHGLEGTAAACEHMGFAPGRPSALAAGLGEAGGAAAARRGSQDTGWTSGSGIPAAGTVPP